MTDIVRLSHTAHGAKTSIKFQGLQVSKEYPTMQAAVEQAAELNLISRHQELSLDQRGMALPVGLTTLAEHLNYEMLFANGFKFS